MPSPVALPGVSKIVAVGSGKGGVGKTTVAVNLAIALSKLGQRVGLMDADVYGPNVPLMMGSSQSPKIGEGNMIEPNLTHGLKTISIGYISPGDKPLVMRGLRAAHHQRHVGPVHIRVHQADALAQLAQRNGQVHGHRGFSHAALTGTDGDDLRNAGQSHRRRHGR